MKSTDSRNLIGTIIASQAASGNVRSIPNTQPATGDGAATMGLGFPPETFVAKEAGGIPPSGQDMNGFLSLLSSAIQNLQANNMGIYDSGLAQAIGGYPLNAIVSSGTSGAFWVSTTESNMTVPGDSGATWANLFAGLASLTGNFTQPFDVGFATKQTQATPLYQVNEVIGEAIESAVQGLSSESWVEQFFAPIAGNSSQPFDVGPATGPNQVPQLQQVESSISAAVNGLASETWAEQNFAPIAGNSAQSFAVAPATGPTQTPQLQQVQSLVGGCLPLTGGKLTGPLVIISEGGTTSPFVIDGSSDDNGANIQLIGNGESTPNKSIRAQDGFFQILNSSYTLVIFQSDDVGNMSSVNSIELDSPATQPAQVPQLQQVESSISAAVNGLASETWAEQNFAPIAGNSAQSFAVAPATGPNQAVALSQFSGCGAVGGSTPISFTPVGACQILVRYSGNFGAGGAASLVTVNASNTTLIGGGGQGTGLPYVSGSYVFYAKGGDEVTITLTATGTGTQNFEMSYVTVPAV